MLAFTVVGRDSLLIVLYRSLTLLRYTISLLRVLNASSLDVYRSVFVSLNVTFPDKISVHIPCCINMKSNCMCYAVCRLKAKLCI